LQTFSAAPNQSRGRSNGELNITPTIEAIDYVSFAAAGRVNRFESHEFSLAALTVTLAPPAAPVPLPPAFGLLGLGLAVLASLAARRPRRLN
jgi:hypothetical protein